MYESERNDHDEHHQLYHLMSELKIAFLDSKDSRSVHLSARRKIQLDTANMGRNDKIIQQLIYKHCDK